MADSQSTTGSSKPRANSISQASESSQTAAEYVRNLYKLLYLSCGTDMEVTVLSRSSSAWKLKLVKRCHMLVQFSIE
jgi:hypothetical protein